MAPSESVISDVTAFNVSPSLANPENVKSPVASDSLLLIFEEEDVNWVVPFNSSIAVTMSLM